MKKLKYLLILSLIAVISVCVLIGCEGQYDVDRNELPYKITYCANGGSLNGKTERYFYVEANVRAIEPTANSSNNTLIRPNRVGYELVGWVRGDIDENGNPVLLPERPDLNDGGVWMNFEGAIMQDQAIDPETGEILDETAKHQYYKYGDLNDEDIWWDFATDYVTEDIVLVAIWKPYNKFMFAERDITADSGWENLDKLLSPDFKFGTELHEQYSSRMHDLASANEAKIEQSEVESAFEIDRKDYTPIRFYSDPACLNEIEFPYAVEDDTKVTVIYYTDIKGDYKVINEHGDPVSDFASAISANQNIYVDADIDMAGGSVNVSSTEYTGTILGNFHKITNMNVSVTQTFVDTRTENTYGGIFGDLSGAKISDLTIECNLVFSIAVDPSDPKSGHKDLDELCKVGAFSKTMRNTALKNVHFKALYIIDRSETTVDAIYNSETGYLDPVYGPNDYAVTVEMSDWTSKPYDKDTTLDGCECEVREMTDAEKKAYFAAQHNPAE